MKSPPLAASRTALVATAVMRETPWRSASVRNADSVRTPASIASAESRPLLSVLLAQPHHVLGAVEDAEAAVRLDLGHDHVDGVAADVDSRDSHIRPGYRLCRHTTSTTTAGEP